MVVNKFSEYVQRHKVGTNIHVKIKLNNVMHLNN